MHCPPVLSPARTADLCPGRRPAPVWRRPFRPERLGRFVSMRAMDATHREQLEAEQERLAAVRAGLLAQSPRTPWEESDLAGLDSATQHPADLGTETFDRERDLSVLEEVEAELTDIERALQRLTSGTYGLCEGCGRPIEPDRLEAVPAARLCLADQRLAEADASRHRAQEEGHRHSNGGGSRRGFGRD